MMIANLEFLTRMLMAFHIKSTNQRLCNGLNGSVEKWEGSDKNLRNCPKIKWLIYIINH